MVSIMNFTPQLNVYLTIEIIKHEHPTMCIVHKGFGGFQAVSPASILGANLIGFNPAIPYDTIHRTLAVIPHISTSRIEFKKLLYSSLAN